MAPRGDTEEMARKLLALLDDEGLRRQFSEAAKREIAENGNIEKLAQGFRDALRYATGQALVG